MNWDLETVGKCASVGLMTFSIIRLAEKRHLLRRVWNWPMRAGVLSMLLAFPLVHAGVTYEVAQLTAAAGVFFCVGLVSFIVFVVGFLGLMFREMRGEVVKPGRVKVL